MAKMLQRIATWYIERSKRAERRSLENPAIPISEASDELLYMMGGRRTGSGIRVNERTALQHGPVWRAVNLIARDVGRCPIHIYDDKTKERMTSDHRYVPLRRRPNETMGACLLKMHVTHDVLIWGNGYVFPERERSGRLHRLIRLHPSMVTPSRVQETDALVYEIALPSGKRYLPPEDIIHIRGLGDGDAGWGIVEIARSGIALGMATRMHGEGYFARGAAPTTVIDVPGELDGPAVHLVQQQFVERYAGLDKMHIPIVLDKGAKATFHGISNETAQFLESREFDLIEISHYFGIPPHKLGHTSRTSFASLEQENQSYLDSIDPWLVLWEEELSMKLLTEAELEHGETVIEFLREALVSMDAAGKSALYQSAINTGWMSRDEVRRRQNLPPIPDGLGKTFLVQGAMATAETIEDPPAPPAPSPPPAPNDPERDPDEDDDPDDDETERRSRAPSAAVRAVLADAAGRILSRVGIQAEKRAGREAYPAWLRDDLLGHHLEVTRDILTPALGLLGAEQRARAVAEGYLGWVRGQLEAASSADVRAVLAKAREGAADAVLAQLGEPTHA